jgi:hypothetical protein
MYVSVSICISFPGVVSNMYHSPTTIAAVSLNLYSSGSDIDTLAAISIGGLCGYGTGIAKDEFFLNLTYTRPGSALSIRCLPDPSDVKITHSMRLLRITSTMKLESVIVSLISDFLDAQCLGTLPGPCSRLRRKSPTAESRPYQTRHRHPIVRP